MTTATGTGETVIGSPLCATHTVAPSGLISTASRETVIRSCDRPAGKTAVVLIPTISSPFWSDNSTRTGYVRDAVAPYGVMAAILPGNVRPNASTVMSIGMPRSSPLTSDSGTFISAYIRPRLTMSTTGEPGLSHWPASTCRRITHPENGEVMSRRFHCSDRFSNTTWASFNSATFCSYAANWSLYSRSVATFR